MNAFDAVAKLIPERLVSAVVNRFLATQWSPERSYMAPPLQDVRLDVPPADREKLCALVREFEREDAVVNRILDIWEAYTVGSGLQMFPASSSEEWNAEAFSAYRGWNANADLSSRQSFDTMQGVISRTFGVCGESFTLLTESSETGRRRVQQIEPHRCKTPPPMEKQEGKTIFDGVGVNADGRPTSYWFSKGVDKGQETFQQYPADSIVHVFEPSRPGQYRGITPFHPVILDIWNLRDLQKYEMKAAKDASEITNILKNNAGEFNTDAASALKRAATMNIQSGATVATTDRSEWFRNTAGGRAIALKIGEEFQQFKSERPGVAMRDFWRYLTERITIGFGIPYVLVFPDSMQGTVYRGALDMAHAFFRIRSAMFAEHFRRIYEYAIEGEMKYIKVPAPKDWKAVSIQAPRAVNVDVGRNSQAKIAELAGGITNYQAIYSDQGDGWKAPLRQKAIEVRFIKDLAEEFDIESSEIAAAALPSADKPEPETQQQEPMNQ